MINLAILISLVYQYRVGFSGVLVSMGAVGAAMFLAALMVGTATNPDWWQFQPLMPQGTLQHPQHPLKQERH